MIDHLDTKKRILTEATLLFTKYGIRSVSMDDVAKSVGISKKTLYQLYKDKNTLVNEILDVALTDQMQKCNEQKRTASHAIEEVAKSIEQFYEFFNSINPNILYDLKKYHPSGYAKFEKFKESFSFNNIKNNLLWGVKEGLFRDDINCNRYYLI